MDITMAPNNGHKLRTKLAYCASLVTLAFTAATLPATAAQSRLSPEIRTAFYGYQLNLPEQPDKDKGAAWELEPSISWTRQSAGMQTRLRWQHNTVFYKDEQREDRHFNDLSFANRMTFLRDLISWDLNASQSYQLRNSRLGIFSDKITGGENLSRVQRYGSGLSYRSLPSSPYRLEAALNYGTTDSQSPLIDDGLFEYKTDAYSGSWLIGTSQRALNFFWQYNGQLQEIERSSGPDVSIRNHGLVVGVPFAPNFSVIGRAGAERVDNGSAVDNKFDYFGAGVEYRFGARSRVNVTMNRSDSSVFGQAKDTDTFVASEFVLAPTRRTSLEGNFDRRYFGRTTSLLGRYDLRFLSMRLRMSDNIRTQNQFDREQEELGIFVCPDTAADFNDCYRPPSNLYVPVFGESLQQVTIVNPELREELVQTRNIGFTLGYSKNRLNLNLTLNSRKTDYLETNEFNRSNNISLDSSWRLDQLNRLTAAINYYDIDYRNEVRQDKNLSLSVGYIRTLSERSDLRLTARRLNRNSTLEQFDNSENRVWLEYKYRF